MPSLLPVPKARFFDDAGLPLAFGTVECFEAGTSTLKGVFSDFNSTPQTNPVPLDANGEADIWLGEGRYKIVLKTAEGVIRWTVDDVSGTSGEGGIIQTVNSIADLRALEGGVSTIVHVLGYDNPPNTTVDGYTMPADAGGGLFYWDADSPDADDNGVIIEPTVSSGNGRWYRVFDGDVSVKWYGAKGNYILDNNTTNPAANDDDAFFNACSFARSKGLAARVPDGVYLLAKALTCGVPMYGDQKPRLSTNEEYASVNWTAATGAAGFVGSFLVWDKSTLTVSESYMRNVSGAESGNVTFKNLAFMSLSNGGGTEGGGTLFEVTSPASGTKYNFDNLPVTEDVLILNFNIGIKIETAFAQTYPRVEFRGCSKALELGIVATDRATQIILNQCNFKKCGTSSTPFLLLEYTDSIFFNECIFDITSDINLRNAINNVVFNQCYYLSQAGGAGPGGGTNNFLTVSGVSDILVNLVTFTNSTAGVDGGNIVITDAAASARLVITNGIQKDITYSDSVLVLMGSPSNGTITGSGFKQIMTGDSFIRNEVEITGDTTDKKIVITPTGGGTSTADSLNIHGGSSVSFNASVKLFGDTHFAQGAADLLLTAGVGGVNPGDIKLTGTAAKSVQIVGSTLDIQSSIVSDVDLSVVGKGIKIKEGSNATMGQDTLSSGTVTVSTTKVTATSRIFLQYHGLFGGTIGVLIPGTRIAGVSFVIESRASGGGGITAGDNNDVDWLIIEPS